MSRIERIQERDGSMTTYKITTSEDGSITKVLHTPDDRPTIIKTNGDELWYDDGVLWKIYSSRDEKTTEHHENGVESIEQWGEVTWYKNGNVHRDGGLPAFENEDGDKRWYVNGELHRDGGLPAIEDADGDREWYVNGCRYRADGLPNVVRGNGDSEWWSNNKLHRDGGLPAVVRANGEVEYWVKGVRTDKQIQPPTREFSGKCVIQ
jgi:hypothetical protein